MPSISRGKLAVGALALAAAGCALAESDFFFLENFQGAEPLAGWSLSSKEKYANQPVSVSQVNITGFEGEQTLLLKEAHKYYGVARSFDTALENGDKPLVVQYEVKLEESLSCGGAYIKLFQDGALPSPTEFDNDTPYVIMFGPDRCGSTNKVHFILRHQNPVTGKWEEKHAKGTPQIKTDKKSHVYTLVVRPDNSFEIFVDGRSESKGSLLETMDPPVNPPEYIDDPEDSKPSDWVDEAKIADPDATKPDDWDENAPATIPDPDAVKPEGWLDDEPDMVPDPEAQMPEDWDVDEDGEWEAPLVSNPKCEEAPGCGEWERPSKANPAYKGKWRAPMIDNPAYKGEWKPRQIKNPAYFVDEHPSRLPKIGALAVEVWTTNGGIRMDNFVVGFDEAAALQYAEKTWKPKFQAEKAAEDKVKKDTKAKARQEKKKEGGWKNIAEAYLTEALDFATEKPLAAAGTAVAILLSLLYLTCFRSKPAPRAEAVAEVSKEGETDENEQEDEAKDADTDNKKTAVEDTDKPVKLKKEE